MYLTDKINERMRKKCIPARVWIAIMMFTACWMSYTCRLQMPILVVPMTGAKGANGEMIGACTKETVNTTQAISLFVPDKADVSNREANTAGDRIKRLFQNPDDLLHQIMSEERAKRETNDETNKEKRKLLEMFSNRPYDWTPAIRGQVISAYSYGNIPGNFFGGMLATKFGTRHTILWTALISAAVCLVSPLLANLDWTVLWAGRFVVGLMGGVVFPACHTMVANWAPPQEKARFVWSLMGGTFGSIITYPMVAAIADQINWEAAWYIPSMIMFAWILLWVLLAYDSPVDHPRISAEERDYILTQQAGTVTAEKKGFKEAPLKAMFTSIPFISLIILHYGNLFLLFFYQNSMMLYLTKALGFRLTKGGFLASAPWGARVLFGFVFSSVGDVIKKKELVSLTSFRKLATIFSHILPGVFLILVGYVGCTWEIANLFLFLALGFNGAVCISNLSNNQDLSPNFAGILYGIMNAFGTTSGMFLPVVVEEIAGKHENLIERWQIVFWIGASVCILSAVVFAFGGSAEIQSWNKQEGT